MVKSSISTLIPSFLLLLVVSLSAKTARAEMLYECKNAKTGSSTFTHDPQAAPGITCAPFKAERAGYSHTGGRSSGSRSGSGGSGRAPKGGLFGMGGSVEKKLWGK